MKPLPREFYNRDSTVVAQELLGKLLVHEVHGRRLVARIVETEAYMGVEDKAAHSYGGRRTPRVEVMYGQPGRAYVFLIYGMHHCFNVVTREEGIPQAVLVRGLEPVEGLEEMSKNRFGRPLEELSRSQLRALTNGPGKLCQALAIGREEGGADLCGPTLYIAQGPGEDFAVTTAKRVGIDYAEEARDFPWRYYITGNPHVSVP